MRASAGCRTATWSTDTPILASTTLDETPEALHAHGLQRIAALDDERTLIAQRLGYPDAAAYRAFLETDPAQSCL